jgi:hypothetical protein
MKLAKKYRILLVKETVFIMIYGKIFQLFFAALPLIFAYLFIDIFVIKFTNNHIFFIAIYTFAIAVFFLNIFLFFYLQKIKIKDNDLFEIQKDLKSLGFNNSYFINKSCLVSYSDLIKPDRRVIVIKEDDYLLINCRIYSIGKGETPIDPYATTRVVKMLKKINGL